MKCNDNVSQTICRMRGFAYGYALAKCNDDYEKADKYCMDNYSEIIDKMEMKKCRNN